MKACENIANVPPNMQLAHWKWLESSANDLAGDSIMIAASSADETTRASWRHKTELTESTLDWFHWAIDLG